MSGGIYLIQDGDRLVEMTEQAYDSEDQLQELLEKYPNLLAGDQIDKGTPRHWLLISREIAVPSEEEGPLRWALDHLFLGQDATPTLVTVKRSSQEASRRELMGQMLEYGANVAAYWPVESIIAQFESNCRDHGRDPEQVFEEFLGANADEERFWQKVKTNLQAGKIRLVFVADEIVPEIRRVVEFLNEQMDPAEVLALEIKQYVSQEDLRTLVARLIGQTAEAQQKKASATRERRRWDEVSFFQEFEARRGRDEGKIARKIHEWACDQEPAIEVHWGTGDTYGGFSAKLDRNKMWQQELFTVDISGQLGISSSSYASMPPFNSESKWQELRTKLSSIGLSLPADRGERRLPSLRLSTLHDELTFNLFRETFEWVVEQIKAF
jgi:hypothetical protein